MWAPASEIVLVSATSRHGHGQAWHETSPAYVTILSASSSWKTRSSRAHDEART